METHFFQQRGQEPAFFAALEGSICPSDKAYCVLVGFSIRATVSRCYSKSLMLRTRRKVVCLTGGSTAAELCSRVCAIDG